MSKKELISIIYNKELKKINDQIKKLERKYNDTPRIKFVVRKDIQKDIDKHKAYKKITFDSGMVFERTKRFVDYVLDNNKESDSKLVYDLQKHEKQFLSDNMEKLKKDLESTIEKSLGKITYDKNIANKLTIYEYAYKNVGNISNSTKLLVAETKNYIKNNPELIEPPATFVTSVSKEQPKTQPVTQPVIPTSQPPATTQTPNKDNSLAIGLGVFFGILFLIFIIVLIVFVVKYYKMKNKSSFGRRRR